MSRARTSYTSKSDTSTSGFLVPPLAIILFGLIFALLVSKLDTPTQMAPAALQGTPATIPTSGLSPIFTQEIQHWSDSILRWASASNLDPNLAAVVMQIESCGDPRATSRVGAMGLFQVMPFHFLPAENPYHPETNALRGLGYLKRSFDAANGNSRLALAGYNGGIGVIQRSESSWSSETQRYVYYGEPIYEDARSGVTSSAILNEWYARYGAGLCRQAAQRLGLQ